MNFFDKDSKLVFSSDKMTKNPNLFFYLFCVCVWGGGGVDGKGVNDFF